MECRGNNNAGIPHCLFCVDGQLHDLIVETETLTAKQKNAILLDIGQTDKMLIDGGDEALGLLDLCLQIGGILAR
jgi:Replication factor C C-terminal domain